MRSKRVALFAAGVLSFAFVIYRLFDGAYMYAAGSVGLAAIYFWLGLKNATRLDDNLEQSLSEVTDALPDINDNLYL